jgi:hypothetical protein
MKTIKIKENINNELSNNRQFIEECVNRIEYGILNDELIIPIIKAKTDDKTVKINCHRQRWDIILNWCMNFYIKEENYEECHRIKKLINYFDI